MKIAVIGGGNLGSALAKALVKKYDVVVTRRNPEKIDFLRELGCEITSDNAKAVQDSDIVLLTVKKSQVKDVLSEIPKDKITVSFVAGLTFKELEMILKKPVKAMTMLSAEFGKGFSIYYSKLGDEDNDLVERVLSCFGDVFRGEERDVDNLTAFASSLAFIPKIYEAFVYSGLRLGYSSDIAKRIALQVFEGGVELLKSYEPHEIVEKIVTPAGTTIEGLCKLMERGVEFGIIDAIQACAKRFETL
ncbi:pyrroline-5-carboxylate reductase family protein [Archaeoglobus sp.]